MITICTEEQVQAIPAWQVADCFSPLERAVLAYTDCLVVDGGRVPDGAFEALREGLSDEEILDLTHVTCMYEMHATMSRALRLEYDDVDERVVEGPAPRRTRWRWSTRCGVGRLPAGPVTACHP